MSMEVSKEVRVKKEPISDSQSISETREAAMRSNYEQSIKIETDPIQIIDRKRNREDISSENQPNKRKRQSTKVKEDVEDVKTEEKLAKKTSIQSVWIAFLNEESTTTTTENNPKANINQPKTINNQPNNPRKKKSKVPNNLKGSYKCNTCKEVFNGENQLRKHQRIHTGERANECDICFRSFDQPIDLEMHKMIHSGKKPYNCDLCDKAFFESFRLESHRKSHFRERLFECDICQMRLINSNDLESHRRTHCREKL